MIPTGEKHRQIKAGTDRGFALTFAIVFLIVAAWPLTTGGGTIRLWALIAAILLLLIAIVVPNSIHFLNRVWFAFGISLGKIFTPIFTIAVFFLVVTPTGLIMRVLGKDLLCKKVDKSAKTYWIDRGPTSGSMKNQF
tara:strand:- start:1248 stop:1658 length:411 start_codon:yes stop_codon:yes gene_type:complete